VSYYYRPVPLESGASLYYAITLAAADAADIAAGFAENQDDGLPSLRSLLEKLDQYIAGKITLDSEELAAIERRVLDLRSQRETRQDFQRSFQDFQRSFQELR
jgi:hypothetical protein